MAQPRVYRDGMQCPRCGSNWLPKYGRSRGRQTCRCGQCLYHFIPETEHPHQPEQVKNLAVSMYAEGSGIEAISRILGMKGWDCLFLGQKKPAWSKICCRSWGAAPGP